MASLFRLALHVTDLAGARRFYGDARGCREGRSTDTWVDFDFEGRHPGEQWTMFFRNPFGNPIEVKGFASLEGLDAS